jgi:carbonic anhydrase
MRFASGEPRYGHQVRRAVSVATSPAPFAIVLGCMDTRVPVEAVLDQDFGSVFVVRTGGHVLDGAALGSIEIAVGTVGVPLVLVLGHRRCAAVATAVTAWQSGRRPSGSVVHVVDDITDAILFSSAICWCSATICLASSRRARSFSKLSASNRGIE